MKPMLIATDHAGFELKENLKKRAGELGLNFLDLGTHSADSVDYPDYSNRLCEKLIQAHDDESVDSTHEHLGILICGSGIGVSIAANRFPQIRAVLAETEITATLGRQHNHANVLCLGARFMDATKAIGIIKAFLAAKPDTAERHARRVDQLSHPPKKEFP